MACCSRKRREAAALGDFKARRLGAEEQQAAAQHEAREGRGRGREGMAAVLYSDCVGGDHVDHVAGRLHWLWGTHVSVLTVGARGDLKLGGRGDGVACGGRE